MISTPRPHLHPPLCAPRPPCAPRLPSVLGPPFVVAALASVVLLLAAPQPASAQIELCLEAERFVREVMGMTALAEPDTIDDWRTRKMVPGCRITAAGGSRLPSSQIVEGFYAQVELEGWTRSPDPRDAPNEASLRFRRSGADCLFNFYDNTTTLATEAELVVSDAVPLAPGEALFNFLILCTPSAPAAPRGPPLS